MTASRTTNNNAEKRLGQHMRKVNAGRTVGCHRQRGQPVPELIEAIKDYRVTDHPPKETHDH